MNYLEALAFVSAGTLRRVIYVVPYSNCGIELRYVTGTEFAILNMNSSSWNDTYYYTVVGERVIPCPLLDETFIQEIYC